MLYENTKELQWKQVTKALTEMMSEQNLEGVTEAPDGSHTDYSSQRERQYPGPRPAARCVCTPAGKSGSPGNQPQTDAEGMRAGQCWEKQLT